MRPRPRDDDLRSHPELRSPAGRDLGPIPVRLRRADAHRRSPAQATVPALASAHRRSPARATVPALAGALVLVLGACSPSSHGAGGAATSGPSTSATPTTAAPTTAAPTTATPTTAAPPAPSGSPSPAPAPSSGLVIDAAQAGRSFSVRPGAALRVDLAGGQLWAEPRASDDGVLARIAGTTDPRTGTATATFRARAAGTAQLRSSRRCLPVAGRVCPQYIALWSVTVTVR